MMYADECEIDEGTTSALMNDINRYVDRLRSLKDALDAAEAEYKAAKEAYETFSRKTVPDIFKLNGLSQVTSDDGRTVSVVTKTTCSIRKDEEKREEVIQWLRKKGAGALIKEKCIVPIEEVASLEANGIIFRKDADVNTNSVKAFLLDALGQKGSPAVIGKEEIPEGISFFQWDEMEVK